MVCAVHYTTDALEKLSKPTSTIRCGATPGVIGWIFSTFNVEALINRPEITARVPPSTIFALIGALFVSGAAWLTLRAFKSKSPVDDFFAVLGFYVALQVALGVWINASPVVDAYQNGVIVFLMVVWIVFATFRAKGMDDSKIFFRGAVMVLLIFLFYAPGITLNAAAGLVTWIGELGAPLQIPQLLQCFGLLGVGLGSWFLYGAGARKGKSTEQVLNDLNKKITEEIEKAKSKGE